MYAVDASADGTLIASACKSSTAEHAAIRVWRTSTWSTLQVLSTHSLTVTCLRFSPCGQYLVSVSRDRTICLFRLNEEGVFSLVKQVKAHARIVWAASWTPDSSLIVTASRDHKVNTFFVL